MHWSGSTTFDDSIDAPEKTFWDAEEVGQAVCDATSSLKTDNPELANMRQQRYSILERLVFAIVYLVEIDRQITGLKSLRQSAIASAPSESIVSPNPSALSK